MRTALLSLLCLAFALLAIGCDSVNNESRDSDADRIEGMWRLVSVRDGDGDQTATFNETVDQFSVTFNADDTYSLTVVFSDPSNPLNEVFPLTGTFEVDETSSTITLSGIPLIGTLPFIYTFETDDRVVFRVPASQVVAINALFGATLVDPIEIVVERI